MKLLKVFLIAVGIMFALTIILAVIKYTPPNQTQNIRQSNTQDLNRLLATPDNPAISPSGKYQLQVTEGSNGLVQFRRFDIAIMREKGDPDVVFVSKDTFRMRDKLFFIWDKSNRVWVYSGDVGLFYWTPLNDSNWEKRAWSDNKAVPIPDLLKQILG